MTHPFTLVLERHGGFAGMSLRAELVSGDMTAQEAENLWGLVKEAPLGAAASSSPDVTPLPDSFTYRLTVTAPHSTHTYAFGESAVGEKLRPLLERLERHLA